MIGAIFDRYTKPNAPKSYQDVCLGSIPTVLTCVMVCRGIIDAGDAAIDSPTTRLGQMPRDIRDFVLRPMLWINDHYFGVHHRNGGRYGVRHTDGSQFEIKRDGITVARIYADTGLLHRVGGPAFINDSDRDVGFYEHGRLRAHNTGGAAFITQEKATYPPGRAIAAIMARLFDTVIMFSMAPIRRIERGLFFLCVLWDDREIRVHRDGITVGLVFIKLLMLERLHDHLERFFRTVSPHKTVTREYAAVSHYFLPRR